MEHSITSTISLEDFSLALCQPRVKTVKRLFALSRNRCGFSKCKSPLVEDTGVVTGEICHIRAHNADGPRFDRNQTDELRHGFENLILMCPSHHKQIDETPVVEFTPERLIEMKSAHESGTPEAEPQDAVIHTLLTNSGFVGDVEQTAGSGGVNVVATNSSVVVTTGLTFRDAEDIAAAVYKRNALELGGIAKEVAATRAEELTNAFITRLRAQSSVPPETLSDPDMHYVLFEAQRHAARTGNKDLSAVLVDLLVERATHAERDLLQIVLGEAVATAGRLTLAQCDALALIFLLRYCQNTSARSISEVSADWTELRLKILGTAATSAASFQHMEYAGCGTSGIGSVTLATVLRTYYAHCFVTSLERAEFEDKLKMHPAKTDELANLGLFAIGNSNDLSLNGLSSSATEALFKQAGLESATCVLFRNLLQQKTSAIDPLDLLKKVDPEVIQLELWWDVHPAHFQLTSVGIAIAHANLRRHGFVGLELPIWIH